MPVTCIECKYDLTGTPRSSRCPECGKEVEASYYAFENPQALAQLHPAAWSALVLCTLGAVLPTAILIWLVVETGETPGGVLFLLAMMLWNASPFLGLMGLVMMIRRRRAGAIAALCVSIVVAAFTGWYYLLFLRLDDPLAGLVFMVIPLYAWFAVAPALFAGAVYTICSEDRRRIRENSSSGARHGA